MSDWTQRGNAATHRYRGYYDARERSTPCEQCSRPIRFCYSLHDKNGKSFIIGTCCFRNYIGTKTLVQLEAAKVLQEATLSAILRDTKLYGSASGIRERRKHWSQAKRKALGLLRAYRKQYGEWLPKELFELQSATSRVPRSYKRQGCALRWYENQTFKLSTQTKEAEYVLLQRSI